MTFLLKPYTRHLILLFVVGFTWGYVAKTIIGKYYYIGWDDPQVVVQSEVIDFTTLQATPVEVLMTATEDEETF